MWQASWCEVGFKSQFPIRKCYLPRDSAPGTVGSSRARLSTPAKRNEFLVRLPVLKGLWEGADGKLSLSDIGTTLFHLGLGGAEALLRDHSENEPGCCHMQVEKLYFQTGGKNKLPLLALREGQHWPQVGAGHGGEAQGPSPLMESSGQEGNVTGQT